MDPDATQAGQHAYERAVERGFDALPADRASRLEACLAGAESAEYRDWYAPSPPAAPPLECIETWARRGGYRLDERGIVEVRYGAVWHRNPLTTASQAILTYANVIGGTAASQRLAAKSLLVILDTLRADSAASAGDMVLWPYGFQHVDMAPGWTSGLAQAAIADVFLKTAALTGTADDHERATGAARALVLPVSDGGVASMDDHGHPWIEEYAGSRHYRRVLNGFISTLLIVLNNRADLAGVIGDDTVAGWASAIRAALPEYTHRDWVEYAWRRGVTPVEYLPQMAERLRWIDTHLPHHAWETYAGHWENVYERQRRRGRLRRAVLRMRAAWRTRRAATPSR